SEYWIGCAEWLAGNYGGWDGRIHSSRWWGRERSFLPCVQSARKALNVPESDRLHTRRGRPCSRCRDSRLVRRWCRVTRAADRASGSSEGREKRGRCEAECRTRVHLVCRRGVRILPRDQGCRFRLFSRPRAQKTAGRFRVVIFPSARAER